MEPQIVVASLQRITTEAVEIQARASRHQDALAPASRVVQAFEVVAPGAVLLDLVEKPRCRRRQLALEDRIAVSRNVEVEVGGRIADDHLAELCLAHLPRPADEDHLAREILLDRRLEITPEGCHLPTSG